MKMIIAKDVEAWDFIMHLSFFICSIVFFLPPFVKIPNMLLHVPCNFLLQSLLEHWSAMLHMQCRDQSMVFSQRIAMKVISFYSSALLVWTTNRIAMRG